MDYRSQLENERGKQSRHVPRPKDEPTLRQNELLDAMVAACAVIAYADGNADVQERRRLLGLMRRIPMLEGFSRDDLADEFAVHERAFAIDPARARQKALEAIAALRPNADEARALVKSCEEIMRADGIAHPLEHVALRAITRTLER
jgi:tellurite resistance protein